MRTMPHRVVAVAFAAIAIGAGVFLGMAGWPQANRTLEFAGLIAAAILTSAFAMPRPATKDWATMTPAFVFDFISLLMLGPHATMLVASADTVTEGLTDPASDRPIVRALVNTAIVLTSVQAAGAAYLALGGTLGAFVWPMQGVPIAAAIVAYCLVKSVAAEIVVPLVTRKPINRAWPKNFLRGCPTYFIGASIAVALSEVIDRKAWEILPVIAAPLFFAYRAHSTQASPLGSDRQPGTVVDALEQGTCAVDRKGVITSWNDAVERMLDCPRARANGRPLVSALPALGKTDLPRAIDEALKSRTPRTLSQLALAFAAGTRVFEIRILPGAGGVTLLWRDVTDRARAEYALKRSEDRFALAAEGSNDGLWEFDVRSKECYFSGRWRTMIGLPAFSGIGHLDEWMTRVHPDDVAALKEALEAHLAGKTDQFHHEHRLRHEDGTYRRFLCRGAAVRGTARRAVRVAGSLTDTTERAIAQEQLRSAGFRDPLTGLCNRTVFVEGLGRRLEEFKKGRGGCGFATLYLDLDRFKIVNDSLGHLVGDELLTAVSRRLESCLRQGDALARLGGDEFAILLNELEDEQQSNAIAFRIQKALSAPFSIGGREVFTSASIGIAFGRVQYNNPEEIMRDADTAMYHAKSRGKARHELFDSVMHARALDRLGLENDLRRAVDNNDFQVHYQPIVLLATGKCVGFESLVRWSRNGEPISPATFVPMAEELGLIEPLGTWVLKQACATFADWQRRYPDAGLDYITVNVSSRQLMQHNFLRIVEQAVHDARLKPCDLRLEITETALMDSPTSAAELLRQLRDFGVKIYLDDFGTGYSSLSHLHKLPVDALKIDRSFVNSLLLPDRSPIVESILALARTLNTSVVAEGIETEVQAHELARLGCTHAQGYLFSRPVAPAKIEEILVANQSLMPKPVQTANPVPAAGVSGPFEWPEHVPVGHGAVQQSAS
jgi:diguanylate cyclase (GGDEF)-like protein/PAS domain S-box-containing protein